MRSIIRKRVIPVLLAAALILSAIPSLAMRADAATQTITVIYHLLSDYSDSETLGGFTVTTGGTTYQAFCLEADEYTPTRTSVTVTAAVTEITNPLIRAAMYYGYNGPAAISGITEYGTHEVASYYYSGQVTFDGWSSTDAVSSGAAALKSYVEANSGSVPDSFQVYACTPVSGYQTIGWWVFTTGYLDLVKTSSDTDITDGNSCYSLAGAQYSVYTDSACSSAAADADGNSAVFVLDSAGNADALELTAGTYYVKETAAGIGYSLDSTVYTVTVTAGSTTYVNGSSGVSDAPLADPVNLLLQKACAESGENAALSGAVYRICYYANDTASGTAERIWYFETDEEGCIYLSEDSLSADYESDDLYLQSGTAVLPLGSISVQEVLPPEGFLLDETVYMAVIGEDDASAYGASLTWSDDSAGRLIAANDASEEYATHYESVVRGDLVLYKTDADGNGMAYIPFLLTRTWTDANGLTQTESRIIITDADGRFDSSDGARTAENTNVYDPADYVSGLSWIGTDEELAAGDSYGIWFGDIADMEEGMGALLSGTYTVQELQCSANAGQTLLTRTFVIDGTDDDGNVKTTADAVETVFVSVIDLTVEIDTVAVYTATGGKTVYPAEETVITEKLTITNLSSDAVYKVRVDFVDGDGVSVGSAWSEEFTAASAPEAVTIDVDAAIDVSAYTDGGTITALSYLYQVIDGTEYLIAQHADMTDEDEQLMIAALFTSAIDSATEDRVGTVSEEAAIIDTVTYEGLESGGEYVLFQEIADEDGTVYTSQEYTFTVPDAATSGTVAMPEITVDAASLSGKTLCVNETLYRISGYDDDGEPVLVTAVVHDSISLEDENQMIFYPRVETTAADDQTQDSVGTSSGTAQIIDNAAVTNLIAGEMYEIRGTLHYQEDFTDADGVFHEAGEEIEGELISAAVGDTVLDITDGTAVFTATSSEMTIRLVYEMDSTLLEGASAVVFEDLIHNNAVVYSHADLTDEEQTVHYPAVMTVAVDNETSDDVGTSEEEASVTDTVTLTNLEPGMTYTLSGTLMDRSTGYALKQEDTEITALAEIVVSEDGSVSVTGGVLSESTYDEAHHCADAVVKLTFTLNSALLEGSSVVVFEELRHNGVAVAEHADIDADYQTVNYPKVKTSAVDAATGDHVGSIWGALINGLKTLLGETDADGNGILDDVQQNIIDTVQLTNLAEGRTYTIAGILMDAETGEEILIDGETVTQTAEIQVSDSRIVVISGAENAKTSSVSDSGTQVSGSVDLVFSFDSSLLNNKDAVIVVFEDLYHNGIKVASHNDLTDTDQSVYEAALETTALDSVTGSHTGTAGDTESIIDEVNMAALAEDAQYTVEGILIDLDASTAEELVYIYDSDGRQVTASVTFTAASDDASFQMTDSDSSAVSGIVYLEFDLSGTDVEGKSIAAVESIFHNGVLLSQHGISYDDDGNLAADADQAVYYPTGKTNITDDTTGTHTAYAFVTQTLTDNVYFQNLIIGKEYRITGTLYNQETGEAISGTETTVTFTAGEDMSEYDAQDVAVTEHADGTKTVSGYIPVIFTFAYEYLEGITVIAGEDFYVLEEEPVKIFSHLDLEDLPQTIRYPALHTNASVGDLDEADVYNEDGSYAAVTITDTVSYENLWTAEELEALSEEGLLIQNGVITDLRDGEVYGIAEEADYLIKGTLMVKETGEALLDAEGNEVISYAFFTPETSDGSIDLTFDLDLNNFLDEDGACYLEGITLVVFEELYLGTAEDEEMKIGSHEEMDDADQDIRFPEGHTHVNDLTDSDVTDDCTADEESHEHEVYASENVRIIDEISYSNLHGGTVYTVCGTLMLKETGEAVTDDGGNVIMSAVVCDAEGNILSTDGTFTTDGEYDDEVSGTVYLLFAFSGECLAGKTVVAFETISRDGQNVLTHADLSDAAQTIRFPGIGTKAADGNTGTSVGTMDETAIIDTVTYGNLIPGRQYTVSGWLMDQETGEAYTDADGNTVTASVTFTASDTGSGDVSLTYSLDAEELAGACLVVFEELYYQNVLIGAHKDLTDQNQTIYFPNTPETGDRNPIGLWICLAAAAAAVLAAVLFSGRRRKNA